MVELQARRVSIVTDTGAILVAPTDLCLRTGELVALVGPNGAGKSSLVRILAGVANHEGTVELDGAAMAAMAPDRRARKIAWLPQTSAARLAGDSARRRCAGPFCLWCDAGTTRRRTC